VWISDNENYTRNQGDGVVMGKKKKTLPKNFQELIEAGDIAALKEVFSYCEWDARGGYNKETALAFNEIPDELVRWLVEQGADINVRDNYQREAITLTKRLHDGNGDDEPERLAELAVRWVLANPNPIMMKQPDYKR
jgi:hypothetical protein